MTIFTKIDNYLCIYCTFKVLSLKCNVCILKVFTRELVFEECLRGYKPTNQSKIRYYLICWLKLPQ